MDSLMRCALAHAAQASLDHLERVGPHRCEKKHESIFRGRPWTVVVYEKPTSGPRRPIEAPRRHGGVQCGRKGRDQRLQRVERETGHLQALRGAVLDVRALAMRLGGASADETHSILSSVLTSTVLSPEPCEKSQIPSDFVVKT